MKFIEVTDEKGDKFLINLDRVEHISPFTCKGSPELNTEFYIVNDTRNISIYVQERYEVIKEMLGV